MPASSGSKKRRSCWLCPWGSLSWSPAVQDGRAARGRACARELKLLRKHTLPCCITPTLATSPSARPCAQGPGVHGHADRAEARGHRGALRVRHQRVAPVRVGAQLRGRPERQSAAVRAGCVGDAARGRPIHAAGARAEAAALAAGHICARLPTALPCGSLPGSSGEGWHDSSQAPGGVVPAGCGVRRFSPPLLLTCAMFTSCTLLWCDAPGSLLRR